MRRFRFPLDPVLRLRGQLEEQAQVELAETRRRLEQQKSALEEIDRRLERHDRVRAELLQSRINPGILAAADPYREELERASETNRAALREAHEIVERSLETLHQRRVDREVLDRLRGRRRAEHRDQELQEEQRSLDETAILRWRKD